MPADKPVIHKVFAYITHERRLLVFRHIQAPQAGIQVPAGTLLPGEKPEAGVLREAREETGRTDLELVSFLGEQMLDRADVGVYQVHHRYFFHLRCAGQPPEQWQHFESDPSDGGKEPIPFEFSWVDLPDGVPPLVADHDYMISALLRSME
jgi:ADP-ribose pyrophosphatase YjhB (NUDIX family)